MKRVIKMRLVGMSNTDRVSEDIDLEAPCPCLFRKDGSTTRTFGRQLQGYFQDLAMNHGLLTVRFDWEV